MKKVVILLLVTFMVLATCACALFHQHTWKDATCTEPKTCTVCGETEGEALGHTWTEATCTEPKTCSICGATEGEALGHTWTEATCTEPKTCSACGETEGEALGHTWVDATCTEPKTCSACGVTEGEALGHTWVDATCTEPKTCSACGVTEGEALGHTWVDATCTEPKTCSACGATEGEALGHRWKNATCTEPKKCTVCGATEGKASGHRWKNATCTEPKKCTVCGATEGKALGHTTTTGVCSRCGKDFGKWTKSSYVDEFNEPTGEYCVINIDYIEGTFSNSATNGSKLYVRVIADKEDVAFMLYEYGRSQVKNASSRYNDKYKVTMKDSTGQKTNLTGTIYCGGDRLFIDDQYTSKVLEALKGIGSVSFYIVMSDRTTTTYLFTVECSNFSKIYASVIK